MAASAVIGRLMAFGVRLPSDSDGNSTIKRLAGAEGDAASRTVTYRSDCRVVVVNPTVGEATPTPCNYKSG